MSHKSYDVSKYLSDPTLTSFSHRVAHFLDWAAKKYPGSFFQTTVILQAVMGYTKTPRSNSRDAQSIKNSMSGAQRHLMNLYRRGLVAETHVGYRATTDSEDVVRNTVVKKAMRLNGARVQLRRALDIVNPREIPNTESGKQLKAYFYNLRDTTKVLFSDEFERRLLPQPEESEAST